MRKIEKINYDQYVVMKKKFNNFVDNGKFKVYVND